MSNKAQLNGNISKVAMYHAGAIVEETVVISIALEAETSSQEKEVRFYWKNSAQTKSRQSTYGFNIVRSLLKATELNQLNDAAKASGLDTRNMLRVWANNGKLGQILDNREVMVGEKRAEKKDGSPFVDAKGVQRIDYTPYPVAYQLDDTDFIGLIKAQKETAASEVADEDSEQY